MDEHGGPTVDGGGGTPLTWTADIAPMWGPAAYNCLVCHSTAVKMGNYSVNSYAEAKMGGGDATPNIIPGDANSTLNQTLRPMHQRRRGSRRSQRPSASSRRWP